MKSLLATIDVKALVLAALLFLAIGVAHADPGLAAKNNCMACHAVDKKLVGPSYRDIANKYRGQSDAPAKLAQKIRGGGSGVWGPIPMPPNPRLTEEEARRLADWVLSTK